MSFGGEQLRPRALSLRRVRHDAGRGTAASAAIHDVLVRDGQTVFVADPDSYDHIAVGGLTYKSVDGGVTFTQLTNVPEMACLTQDASGDLLGCGANWEPDFKAIARSQDGGATWTKQWRFIEMADALQCPAGTDTRHVRRLALGLRGVCPISSVSSVRRDPPVASPRPIHRRQRSRRAAAGLATRSVRCGPSWRSHSGSGDAGPLGEHRLADNAVRHRARPSSDCRIANARMKAVLGVVLRYPSWKTVLTEWSGVA